MRLPWALVLGALLGSAEASRIVVRQDNGQSTSALVTTPPTTTPVGGGGGDTTSTPGGGGGTTTTDGSGGGDQTVFETETVTNAAKTVTKKSTTTTSIVTTSTSVSTVLTTTTTTEHGKDVATVIVMKTITKTVTPGAQNARRTAPAEVDAVPSRTPAAVDAAITAAPVPENHWFDLFKRDTITKTKTVTVGNGGEVTSFDVVTKAITSTKIVVDTSTSVIIKTEYAGATSTTTSTSLYTTTTTADGGIMTGTSTGSGSSDGSSGDSSGSGSSSSSGLSTGAKAGIGVGAAIVGLAVIGGLLFFCLRRRREPKADPDDMVGASEVPVGGHGNPHSPPMSKHSPAAAAFLAPHRSPVSNKTTPEGYRGTAMGDGRAGYAKPEPYGSAYTSPATTMTANTRAGGMGADHLPEHSSPMDMNAVGAGMGAKHDNHALHPQTAELGTDSGTASKWHEDGAAEIDSQPVMGHQSGPVPSDVYEMPAQHYR